MAGRTCRRSAAIYLGGENDVRGFDFYTISPFVAIPNQTTTTVTYFDPRRLDQNGRPIAALALAVPTLEYVPSRPGGDLQAIMNVDYRIPDCRACDPGLL